MSEELSWFILGIMLCLGVGAGTWIACLSSKIMHQKEQISGLMREKGELAMRVSILGDALKEKEQ